MNWNWQLILEYLKVFLSGPVIGGGIIGAALIYFRKGIAGLLDRGIRFKGWGVEYEATQQVQTTETELPAPEEPTTAIQARKGSGLTAEQKLVMMIEQARYWEYRYLEIFLVRSTQLLLDWLAFSPNGMSRDQFDSLWSRTPREGRDAMLNALLRHGLITLANGIIQITDRGRDYLEWRGPLPPPPPPSTPPVPGIGRLLMGAAGKLKAEGRKSEDTDSDVPPPK